MFIPMPSLLWLLRAGYSGHSRGLMLVAGLYHDAVGGKQEPSPGALEAYCAVY
jgi:hypothetical protein